MILQGRKEEGACSCARAPVCLADKSRLIGRRESLVVRVALQGIEEFSPMDFLRFAYRVTYVLRTLFQSIIFALLFYVHIVYNPVNIAIFRDESQYTWKITLRY